MQDQGIVFRAVFCSKNLRYGRFIQSVGPQAVDGFCGKGNQLSFLQKPGRFVQRVLAFLYFGFHFIFVIGVHMNHQFYMGFFADAVFQCVELVMNLYNPDIARDLYVYRCQ